MIKHNVVVIDYGMGNLLSVRRGLEFVGASVTVTANPEKILSGTRIVLPGVGAFSHGMTQLRKLGLDSVVREVSKKGVPLLGICLGMQMLLDESEEFGRANGLGLIPGRVVPIPSVDKEGKLQKIPHIGWSDLHLPNKEASWRGSLLRDLMPGEAVYFIHSFMADLINPHHCLAGCTYGGNVIPAVIFKDNITGCQFHPEKSGQVGLKVLKRFLTQ